MFFMVLSLLLLLLLLLSRWELEDVVTSALLSLSVSFHALVYSVKNGVANDALSLNDRFICFYQCIFTSSSSSVESSLNALLCLFYLFHLLLRYLLCIIFSRHILHLFHLHCRKHPLQQLCIVELHWSALNASFTQLHKVVLCLILFLQNFVCFICFLC